MPTPFMCHDCDSPTMNKSGICDNCLEDMDEPTTADNYNPKYSIDEVRQAVDIAIGDDGMRSKEVIEILKKGV